mgnify:CR=1 FL=1|tara:strand:+ start:2533 stop:2697 length:165 start_codon:yes stop_codon:yes gene_type:complete
MSFGKYKCNRPVLFEVLENVINDTEEENYREVYEDLVGDLKKVFNHYDQITDGN